MIPRQPKTVYAVAFACVICFLGIGLVDPILKPIADSMAASPSQVSLLFTSFFLVIGVTMLLTGWVSSRIGAKRTLLLGLAVVVAGSALAGAQTSIEGIVAARAVWGFGNALFLATALATIVSAAEGSMGQAIVLYEAALGAGIAIGPLVGGFLGSLGWQYPFYGVAVLMALAFVATFFALPRSEAPTTPSRLSEPLRALAHPGLLTVALTALLYYFGFFTLLAFTPFPLHLDAHGVGWVFFGWGLLLALTSVFLAPWLQRRLGTVPVIVGALLAFSATLAVMAWQTENRVVLATCVIVAGAFLGVTNTLVTEVVMRVSPHPRGVASAAYNFVRFGGGAAAPWVAGRLGETVSVHAPFWLGAGTVAAAAVLLTAARGRLGSSFAVPAHSVEEATVLTVADS